MTYNQDGGPDQTVNLDGSGNATVVTSALSATSVFNLTAIVLPSPSVITGQSATITVTPTVTPSVIIGASPAGAVCAGTTVTLTATPTNGGATPGYQWKLGGSDITGATNSTYTYVPTNGDAITCQLTSSAVCPSPATALSSVLTMSVTAYPSAGTITGATSVCVGASTSLSDAAGSGVWSSSDPTKATIDASGVVTGLVAGTVNISYTVTTSGCSSYTTQAFSVNAIPGAGTITGASSVCESASITLSDVTGAGAWSSSNSATATVNSSGVVTGLVAGTATITYTVTSGGCSGYTTHDVTVNPIPSAGTITGASSVCESFSTTLSDATGGGSWTSSAGTIATVNSSGVVTGLTGGTATISYTVTSSGCSASALQAFTVNATPSVAAISGSSSVCVSSSITLTDVTSSGVWSSSSNTVATVDASGVVTGVAGGTVNISYTVTSVAGCTNSALKAVTINPSPSTPVIGNLGNVFAGGSTTLTFSGDANSVVYYWNGSSTVNTTLSGSGTSSVSVSPTVTTTYSVTSVTSSFGCSATVTGVNTTISYLGTAVTLVGWDVSTLTGGTGNYGASPLSATTIASNVVVNTGLSRGSGVATAGSAAARGWGGSSWTGTSVATSISSNQFATFTIQSNAVYNINIASYTLNYRRSGGGATTGQLQYSINGGTYINVGSTISFSSSAGTGASLGSVDLSGVTALQNIPGTSTLTFRLCNYGGSSGGTWYVYDQGVSTSDDYFFKGALNCVSAPISVTAAASSTAICAGNTLTLTGSAVGAESYSWSGPGGYSSTQQSPVFTSSVATGVFTLTATNACGSTVATTSTVTVSGLPTGVTASASPTPICAGSTLTISGTATGASTYSWSGPASFSSTLLNPASFTSSTTSAGVYTLTAINGTCTVTATTASVTVNILPTSVSANASSTSLCVGSTLTISGTATGSALSYSWTGPNSFTSTLLNPASFAAAIASAGSYSLVVSSGVCSVSAATASVAVYSVPTASITSSVAPCMGYSTTVQFTGTPGANITYTIDGGSSTIATLDAGTGIYSFGTGTLTSSHLYTLVNAYNPACTTAIGSSVTISPIAMQWVGGTSSHETDWNYASNWSCGFVPGASDDVNIPSTGFAPSIGVSSSGTVKNLTIASGVILTVNSGGTLNVKDTLKNNGTVTGSGSLIMNNSSTQYITGIGTVNNFTLSNTSGAAVLTGSRLTINKVLTITAGTLVTADSLVLASTDTNGTARVAALPPSGAAISGNVKVMQYIQGGYRRYRFLSHPFSASISLGQVGDYIDITGTGGATKGFTTTGSNASSAFRYNTNVANSALSYDAGWKAFNNITASASDTDVFHPYQGIRVFMRGAKGEGLGYDTYIPSPTVIGMTGPVNQGSQTITLTKGGGANQDYNLLGNPYPSPVDIGTVLYNAQVANQVVGAAFYVWNPSIGVSGMYQAITINSVTPYYLEANAAFEVRADHNNATLSFTESNKAANATNYLFKAQPESLSLYVYDVNYHPWDMLYIRFNDAAGEAEDKYLDAVKLTGSDFSFYSTSADNKKMVIDSRPYNAEKVVPLGISSAYHQEFIIKAEGVVLPNGGKVYLHDKLLQKYVLLEPGTEYRFNVSKDKATQGDNRFELAMKPAAAAADVRGLNVAMTPNPAIDEVNISYTSGKMDNVSVRVLDMSGVSVYSKDFGTQQNGSINVSLSNLASGIYMVELSSGNEKVIRRLVKE